MFDLLHQRNVRLGTHIQRRHDSSIFRGFIQSLVVTIPTSQRGEPKSNMRICAVCTALLDDLTQDTESMMGLPKELHLVPSQTTFSKHTDTPM